MIQVRIAVAALSLAASAAAGATAHILLTKVDVQCGHYAEQDEAALRDFMRPAPPPITGNPRY